MIKVNSLLLIILVCIACNKSKVGYNANNKNPNSEVQTSKNLKEDLETTNFKTIDNVSYKIYHLSENSLKDIFKDTTNEYGNFTCFYFDIEIANENDIVNYPSSNYVNLNDKIQYLSFMIKNYMQIEAGGKKYNCINSTFDRTYGQSKSSRFFLVFDKIKQEEITFKYDDDYFDNGIIQLKLTI